MTVYEDFGTGKRGKEGLDYVAEELGKALKIAFLLKVSVKTVDARRAQLMERWASTMWPARCITRCRWGWCRRKRSPKA